MAKLTGKSSYIRYNGTRIEITKSTPKVTRELADTTDSGNYDATTDMMHKSQLPVSLQTEISIEGFFDTSATHAAIISQLYSGATAVPVILNLATSTIFGHGNFDISDFETDVPTDESVTFSATLKSNGVFIMGS